MFHASPKARHGTLLFAHLRAVLVQTHHDRAFVGTWLVARAFL